jgi:hypothetical protein
MKGTPNKATADVRAAAQHYTTEALDTLATIMRDQEQAGAARVSAAKELLDRGHGKPKQDLGVDLTDRAAAVVAEARARLIAAITTQPNG